MTQKSRDLAFSLAESFGYSSSPLFLHAPLLGEGVGSRSAWSVRALLQPQKPSHPLPWAQPVCPSGYLSVLCASVSVSVLKQSDWKKPSGTLAAAREARSMLLAHQPWSWEHTAGIKGQRLRCLQPALPTASSPGSAPLWEQGEGQKHPPSHGKAPHPWKPPPSQAASEHARAVGRRSLLHPSFLAPGGFLSPAQGRHGPSAPARGRKFPVGTVMLAIESNRSLW